MQGSKFKIDGLAIWVVLVLGALVTIAWTMRPSNVTSPCAVVTGPAALADLQESSGLAISHRTPGLLWSHNDSGNAAVLFAIEPSGTVRGRVKLPVETRDWEDVSAGRCPAGDCLYIADIGDNRSSRKQISIYRVPEPAPGDAQTAAPEVFRATYADGPHNAEAMFVIGTDIFIITRDRTGLVYRSSAASSGGQIVFQRIGNLGLTGVTDAEASPDEKLVVVRTSHEVVFYHTADLMKEGAVPYFRVPIDGLREPQGEGVAIDGDMLYLSSEAAWTRAGSIISLRCTAADPNTGDD